jgi:hypothetical protein
VAAPAEKVPPLADCLASFWAAGAELEALRFSLAAPEVDAAAVKQLGEPAFWSAPGQFSARLSQAYAAITRASLKRALVD